MRREDRQKVFSNAFLNVDAWNEEGRFLCQCKTVLKISVIHSSSIRALLFTPELQHLKIFVSLTWYFKFVHNLQFFYQSRCSDQLKKDQEISTEVLQGVNATLKRS